MPMSLPITHGKLRERDETLPEQNWRCSLKAAAHRMRRISISYRFVFHHGFQRSLAYCDATKEWTVLRGVFTLTNKDTQTR